MTIVVMAMRMMVTMGRQTTRLMVQATVMATEITTVMAMVMPTVMVLLTVTTRLIAQVMERAMEMEVAMLMMVMIRPPITEVVTKVMLKAQQASNLKSQEASWALSSSSSESCLPVLSDSSSTAFAVRGKTISMTTSRMEALFKAIRRSKQSCDLLSSRKDKNSEFRALHYFLSLRFRI